MTAPDPLQVARSLVELGVPVFACPPGDGPKGYKLPQAWQTIKPDPRRLEVYRPGYALAAVCGHVYDVLDRDPRNDPGPLPCEWPTVYGIAGTPGGGEHYYVAATGLPKAKLGQGWDLQAGTAEGGRGFVFLPGTTGYGWVDPPRPVLGTPNLAPLKRYLAQRAPVLASVPRGSLGEAIPRGQHQETLFRYAASLRARGVPESEAAVLVEARAGDCEPPWAGPDSPWDAVRHAYSRYPAGEPALGVELVGFGPAPAGAQGPSGGPPTAEQSALTYADWDALEAAPPVPVDWLVPGVLAAGRGHLIYSPSGHGKSLIALEWAATLARAGRRVLYCDWENSLEGDVWPRLTRMGFAAADLAGLRFLSFPQFRPLDVDGSELVAAALDQQCGLVMLDTASRTIRGPENDNDTWNAWDRATGVLLRRQGVGFVRWDHSGKDVERGARGGSAKGTDVDLIWRFEATKSSDGEIVTLTNEKSRILAPEKVQQFRRHDNPLRHEKVAVALDASMAKKLLVFELLQDLDVPLEEGRDKIKARLEAAKVQISNGALGEVLKARRQLAEHELEVPPAWLAQALADGCWSFGGASPVTWGASG